jgi:hypothetical protein
LAQAALVQQQRLILALVLMGWQAGWGLSLVPVVVPAVAVKAEQEQQQLDFLGVAVVAEASWTLLHLVVLARQGLAITVETTQATLHRTTVVVEVAVLQPLG